MAKSLVLNIPHASSYVPEEDIMKVFLPHISSSFMYDWAIHPEKKEAAEKRKEAIFLCRLWLEDKRKHAKEDGTEQSHHMVTLLLMVN